MYVGGGQLCQESLDYLLVGAGGQNGGKRKDESQEVEVLNQGSQVGFRGPQTHHTICNMVYVHFSGRMCSQLSPALRRGRDAPALLWQMLSGGPPPQLPPSSIHRDLASKFQH